MPVAAGGEAPAPMSTSARSWKVTGSVMDAVLTCVPAGIVTAPAGGAVSENSTSTVAARAPEGR